MITNEQIYYELHMLKELVKSIIQKEAENEVEEISLSKAASLLHKSTDTVKQLVEEGSLEAFKEITPLGKIKYRFLLENILNYQHKRVYNPHEKPSFSVRDLINRMKAEELPDVPERKKKNAAA